MIHLRDADFPALEQQLVNELNARRVWVQYSNNASNVRICITVFVGECYRMFFGERIRDFSYDAIRSLINLNRTSF